MSPSKAGSPPPATLTLALCDDSALARASLRSLLEDEPGVAVIGEAASGGECLELCVRTRPDVLLLDLRMPDLDGIAVTRRLRELAPRTRVIMVTMSAHHSLLAAALGAGAWGYLLKDASRAELLAAIGTVAAGGLYVNPEAELQAE